MTATSPPFRVTLPRDTDPVVRVWSSYQVQHEPNTARPWRQQLLDELRDALAQLDLNPDRVLAGTYMTTDLMPCDAENRLFLNPEPALPTVSGVRFERCPGPPPLPPQPLEASTHLHYYEYRTAYSAPARPSPWRCWRPWQVLASWRRVPQSLPLDGSARPWWIAMRRAAADGLLELPTAGSVLPTDAKFAVRLTVHAAAAPRSLRATRENVIDGVLAAFHAGTPDVATVGALAARVGPALADEVTHLESSDGPGPLFLTPAVTLAGYLSPDDTRCWAGEVTLLRDDADGTVPQLSGSSCRWRGGRREASGFLAAPTRRVAGR